MDRYIATGNDHGIRARQRIYNDAIESWLWEAVSVEPPRQVPIKESHFPVERDLVPTIGCHFQPRYIVLNNLVARHGENATGGVVDEEVLDRTGGNDGTARIQSRPVGLHQVVAKAVVVKLGLIIREL